MYSWLQGKREVRNLYFWVWNLAFPTPASQAWTDLAIFLLLIRLQQALHAVPAAPKAWKRGETGPPTQACGHWPSAKLLLYRLQCFDLKWISQMTAYLREKSTKTFTWSWIKYRRSHAYIHFRAAWHTAQTVQILTLCKSIGRFKHLCTGSAGNSHHSCVWALRYINYSIFKDWFPKQ